MKFPSIVPGDHALILRAAVVAAYAHRNQTRRYTLEPYIIHPISVATKVSEFTMDPHVISAAILHDVVEDTDVTLDEIRNKFGERIADMVDLLTELPDPTLNRKSRKAKQMQRLADASADVQLIKAMDLIDNRKSIMEHDPDFAVVFLRELDDLAKAMTKLDPRAKMMLEEMTWVLPP